MSNNVFSIAAYKAPDTSEFDDMDKYDLMDEMVRFQRRWHEYGLTPDMIPIGLALFTVLREQAKTKELYMLCNSRLGELRSKRSGR